jgi:hypothetical protein
LSGMDVKVYCNADAYMLVQGIVLNI